MDRVPQNPGLKIKANMSIIWVSIYPVQANMPRNQDQGVYYYRQMPETRKVCLESGPKCLNSKQMCTEYREVHYNIGQQKMGVNRLNPVQKAPEYPPAE